MIFPLSEDTVIIYIPTERSTIFTCASATPSAVPRTLLSKEARTSLEVHLLMFRKKLFGHSMKI